MHKRFSRVNRKLVKHHLKRLHYCIYGFASHMHLWVMLPVVIALMGCVSFVLGGHTSEETYFQHSKYRGIETKFVTGVSGKYAEHVEYPTTTSTPVNSVIATYIDAIRQRFQDGSIVCQKRTDQLCSYDITYQVFTAKNHMVSLAVLWRAEVDNDGRHISGGSGWTFDIQRNLEVHLRDVLGKSGTGTDTMRKLVQQAVRPKESRDVTEDWVDPAMLDHFEVERKQFHYELTKPGRGDMPHTRVSVSIPIAELLPYMHTPEAQQIFGTGKPGRRLAAGLMVTAASKNGACATQKCIALTFDDGPSAYTASIVADLQKAGAHATFFVVGRHAVEYSQIVKRELSNHNEVGNHTWDHAYLPKLQPTAIKDEIDRTNKYVRTITGYNPAIFRPPFGGVSRAESDTAAITHMPVILWSVDTRDWKDKNSELICTRAFAGATDGAIILLHDVQPKTAEAMPCIISKLTTAGFKLVTVSDLLGTDLDPGAYYDRAQ